MIGSLRGTVLDRSATGEVLLEVAGVGYRVTVAPATLAALEVGGGAFLHIHHHSKEDSQALYGFLARDERVAFEALLSAHRVGPALAMAILGTHDPLALRRIVAEGDVASLCLVPGVGKQSAARLLIELKTKLDVPELDVATVVAGRSANGGRTSAVADVREALGNLGYGPEEIREALRELPADQDASSLLRDALRLLGARRA